MMPIADGTSCIVSGSYLIVRPPLKRSRFHLALPSVMVHVTYG